jgi:hypothetical protein
LKLQQHALFRWEGTGEENFEQPDGVQNVYDIYLFIVSTFTILDQVVKPAPFLRLTLITAAVAAAATAHRPVE